MEMDRVAKEEKMGKYVGEKVNKTLVRAIAFVHQSARHGCIKLCFSGMKVMVLEHMLCDM